MRSAASAHPPLRRVAMFSVHSCPLATLGGRDTGGMNVYVREVSRHLGQQGIAVDIYTRRQDPCSPRVVEFAPQARVIHLRAGPTAPYSKHHIWDHLAEFLEEVQAFRVSQGVHYDMLHSHYWLSGWVALQLRQTWRVPVVHMSHTLGYAKNAVAQQAWEQEPVRRLQVEYQVLQASDALVAESPASKALMVRDYRIEAAKIQVIPCGVDTTLFAPQDRQQARHALALPATAPLLLFVGRLQPLKGIDTFIRAAQLVRQRYPDVQVLIIGGGLDSDDVHEAGELQRLQALGAEAGLQQQLHFIKAQPQPVLAQYYAAADAVIMPSHYESFGMVVLEAMACGTPVIASDVGGLASTIVHEHTGLLVPVGDSLGFAQAMLRLLDSPALQAAFRRAGLERAGTYAWPRIVERNVHLYQQLLSRQPTTRAALAGSAQPVSSPG